jgi:hypothetical protein
MTNEFRKINGKNETRYVLEDASAGSTSAASIAAVETSLGPIQQRVPKKKKPVKENHMHDSEFNGEYDDEAGMAESNLHTLARAVKGLMDTIDSNDNLPEWCQEKIAKSEMMLVSVWDYLQSQKEQGIDPEQGVAEEHNDTFDPKSHQYSTTMKHADKPTVQQRMAAHDIKPGVAGYRDRIDMLRDLERTDKLKKDEGVVQSPESEILQGRIGSVLIKLYDKGYTEEKIRMMQDRIAKHLGYDPSDKQFQSAFNAVLTNPEQGVAEGGKKKGADGKACWTGYRYAGTKNGKDNCVKVGENDEYLSRLSEKLDISLDEKSKSQKQAAIMAAAAHNPEFAKRVGISQRVAKEFNRADTGKDLKRLPVRVPKKQSKNKK